MFDVDFEDLKKLGILGLVAFLYFPTGDPSDVLVSMPLYSFLGGTLYLLIGLGLLVLVYAKLKWF